MARWTAVLFRVDNVGQYFRGAVRARVDACEPTPEPIQAAFEASVRDDLDGRILSFDESAAEETAILMADRRRAGRSGDLRDTMIAGIAISRRATLATRNTRHFADLSIPIIDPWTS
jgi:predicted nucleic acid-binding protein